MSSLNFSTSMKTFDIFFDNIFTDISVNSQISKSYDDICKLEKNVNAILINLKNDKEKLDQVIENKKIEYDEFVNNV